MVARMATARGLIASCVEFAADIDRITTAMRPHRCSPRRPPGAADLG